MQSCHQAEPSRLLRLPEDLTRLVLTFSTKSFDVLLALQVVSKRFRAIVQNPKMVSMVHAHLYLRNLSALGPLTTALHHVTITGAVYGHHTALMLSLRTLRLNGDLEAPDFSFLMHLHHLQELHMSARADWYRGNCPDFPESLRVLDVSACNVGQLPSLPNLEELNVSMSTNLSAIIPALPKLRKLNMSNSVFDQAAELDFRHLTELHSLDISVCRLQGPILAGHQLRRLDVHACHFLGCLPDLPNLLDLNARACSNLVAFPQLPSLTKLDMTMCPAPLNESMRELQELHLDHAMPAFPLKLRVLECDSLHLEHLHDLTSLTVHVRRRNDVKCFLPTSQLQILDLCGCVEDIDLAHLTHFPNLTSLAVRSARITDDGIQHMVALQGLESLSMERIFDEDARHLDLRITRAGILRLSALKNLRHLKLVACRMEEPMEAVTHIKSLESLHIANNGYVLRLEQLHGLYNLTRLEIEHCYVLSLRGLNRLSRLDTLTITECVGLTCEGWFELLPCALTTLTVSWNDRRLLGHRWGQFVKELRASSPWVEVVQQRMVG